MSPTKYAQLQIFHEVIILALSSHLQQWCSIKKTIKTSNIKYFWVNTFPLRVSVANFPRVMAILGINDENIWAPDPLPILVIPEPKAHQYKARAHL